MVSLADTSPSIALGALDGRYRTTVAPLVDHLSEAALVTIVVVLGSVAIGRTAVVRIARPAEQVPH